MGRNKNDLLDGIEAGTGLANQINNSLDEQERLQQQKDDLAQQLQVEQAMQQRGFAQADTMQGLDAASTSALHSQDMKDKAANDLVLEQAMADRNQQTQEAMLDRQSQLQQSGADIAANKQAHALDAQFTAYQDSLDQKLAAAQAAQTGQDPNDIMASPAFQQASATRRAQTWQQMGPGIFDTAKKDQGFDVSYDPNDPKQTFKVSGKVQSLDDALALRNQLAPAPTPPAIDQVNVLHKALFPLQTDADGNPIPENPATSAAIDQALRTELQNNPTLAAKMAQLGNSSQQQQAPAGAGAAPGAGAPPPQLGLPPGAAPITSATAQPDVAPVPQTQLGAPPDATTQMAAPVPSPGQTGQSAFQALNNGTPAEGQTATNKQTGQRMIFSDGAWKPLTQ